jgi:hypothetical protein
MLLGSVDELSPDDLERLVQDRVSEGKTMEFKQVLDLNDVGHRRTLIGEVVSFANAGGGDIVLGVKEEDGVAIDVLGMDIDNTDKTGGRITHILRQKVEPPIPPALVTVRDISLENDRTVIVIRVRESWRSPHRETVNYQFYGRSSHGKEPLDVDEIKQHVLLSESNAEQIREFRADRIARLQSGRTPIPVEDGPKAVLHIVPFNAFRPGTQIDIQAASIRKEHAPRLLRSEPRGNQERFTADGVVTHWSSLPEPQRSYTLTFRSGAIEAVTGKCFKDDVDGIPYLMAKFLRGALEFSLERYCTFLKTQDVNPPVFAFLSLINAEDYGVKRSIDTGWPPEHTINQPVTLFPEQVIEDYTELEQTVDVLMDFVWNAGGHPGEP